MSASDFEGHEALVAQLRAGTLDAPGHLHRRVLADAPVKRRRWAEMSARRRVLVIVPVAATLAVGAAVAQSAFSSGSSNRATAAASPETQLRNVLVNQQRQFHAQVARMKRQHKLDVARLSGQQFGLTGAHVPAGSEKFGALAGATGAAGPTGPQGPTGATGGTGGTGLTGADSLAAVQGSFNTAARATHGSKGFSGVAIPQNRLVHADATLQVDVPTHHALTADTDKASQIVTQLGGYAQSVQYQASRGSYGSSRIDLRVPTHKAETAIKQLSALGTLVYKTIATQDLQQPFHTLVNQIGSLERSINVYEAALRNGTVTGTQRVQVEIELANARHLLKYRRQAKTQTINYGAKARIQLTLTLHPHHAASVRPAKRGRLGRLLHNVGGFLGLEALIVLYALVVIVPIALLVALLVWIVRERRRREEKLLANA